MVGSVQGTSGSSAYVRGSQLGSSSSASTSRSSEEVKEPRQSEQAETTRSTDSKESLFKASATTEISNRNDTETVQTESTRGSLLDIAV